MPRNFRKPTLTFLLFASAVNAQTWQPLGGDDVKQPSSRAASYVSMSLTKAGQPYVAYSDVHGNGNLGMPIGKRFYGADWD